MSPLRWTLVFILILILSYFYLLWIIPERKAANYLQLPYSQRDFFLPGESLSRLPPRSNDNCENLQKHDWFVLNNMLYDEQIFAAQFREQLRRDNRRLDVQFRRAMNWLFLGREIELSTRLQAQLQSYNNSYTTRLEWIRVMQDQQTKLECFNSVERLVLDPRQPTYDVLNNSVNSDMYIYIHPPPWLAISPHEAILEPQAALSLAWQARCPTEERFDFAIEVIIFRFPLPPIAKEAFLLCS